MPLYRSGLSGSGATLTTTGNLGLGGAAATNYGIEVLGGDIKLDALATPAAPTLVSVNTAGATTWYYFIVAEDRSGYQTLPSAALTVGSAAASPTVNNTIAFTAVSGAVKYYLLRYNSATLPAAPSTQAVLAGTWLSGPLQFVDQPPGSITPLPNFSLIARNTTGDLYVDGIIDCKGNSLGVFNAVFGAGNSIVTTSGQNTIVGVNSKQTGTTGGTVVGYNASISGAGIAIGVSSNNSGGGGSVAIGVGCTASAVSAVAIGQTAQVNAAGGVAVGIAANVNAGSTNAVCLGNSATALTGAAGSISIGCLSSVSVSNACVIGSDTYPVLKVTLGKGETSTLAMTSVMITQTTPTGTNTAGGDMIIAGGKGSGTGLGGSVRIQTALALTGSGTTAGTLLERVKIDQAGNVVLNSGGAALLTTATDGFTYIPTVASTAAGTPTGFTGTAPMIYDTGNNRLWIYNPTGTPAWKYAAFT